MAYPVPPWVLLALPGLKNLHLYLHPCTCPVPSGTYPAQSPEEIEELGSLNLVMAWHPDI